MNEKVNLPSTKLPRKPRLRLPLKKKKAILPSLFLKMLPMPPLSQVIKGATIENLQKNTTPMPPRKVGKGVGRTKQQYRKA